MILKKGSKGEAVKEWQAFLQSRGHDAKPDGDFGPKTMIATKNFQTANGLDADGVVGPATIKKAVELGFGGFSEVPPPPQSGKMQVSQRGRDFIKSFEEEVLKVYDDGYGFPTVGVGHLVKPGDGLKLGDRITKAQSDAFFAQDLAEHAEPVDRLVKVPLTQGQYDALVSLVFNIGGGNFKKSTVLKKLNAGDYAGARTAFGSWVRSAGKVSRGLQRRRNEEQAIFQS